MARSSITRSAGRLLPAAEQGAGPSRAKRIFERYGASGLRVGLGVLLGAVFMVLVLRTIELDAVYERLANATVLPVVVALLAFALDFVLRAVRFSWMLRQATGRSMPLRSAIGPYVASFGVSDILPLRIGDGFRILWFNRRFAIPVGTLAGTMIVERLFDLLTIVILCGVTLALVEATDTPLLVEGLRITLLVFIVAGLGLLLGPALLAKGLDRLAERFPIPLLDRIAALIRESADAMASLRSWRQIAGLGTLSLGLWILESITMIGAWVSLGGGGGDAFKPFLAFAFSTLGTMVPSFPGHFGTFEFFGMQAFGLVHVDESLAAAALLLAHLVIWLPTAVFGICWLMFGARLASARVAPGSSSGSYRS